jgi:proteasome lid subunit RPN8/RPN11
MSKLILPRRVREVISVWAEKAYPNEGCGLLIGQFEKGSVKRVQRLAPLTNRLLADTVTAAPTLPQERQGAGAGKTEFYMDPAEFNAETLKAERENSDVVGIIHTHPDHPARPSQIDASQPFLAQWSNIIVSVSHGRLADVKSWFRETDADPFVEESIFEE